MKNFKFLSIIFTIIVFTFFGCEEETIILPDQTIEEVTEEGKDLLVIVTDKIIQGQEGLTVYVGNEFHYTTHDVAEAVRTCGSDVVLYSSPVPFYSSRNKESATSINAIRLNDATAETEDGIVTYWTDRETEVGFLTRLTKEFIRTEPSVEGIQFDIIKRTENYFDLFNFVVVTKSGFYWNVNELKIGIPIYEDSVNNEICYRFY